MLSPAQISQREGRLTASRVRALLDYDPSTGVFRRRANERGGGVKVGAVVGVKMPTGHIRIAVDGKRYYAHQLAWLYVYGEWPGGYLDHVDNDGGNNRISNLRLANKQQNRANARMAANNTVGLKGVTKLPSGRFHSRLRLHGKILYLGTFDTADEAHAAYVAAARRMFGPFAREA